MREFLTVDECAKRLGVSKETIRRKLKHGEIKACKLNGEYSEWRIDARAFDEYCGATSDTDAREVAQFIELAKRLANDDLIRKLVQRGDKQ